MDPDNMHVDEGQNADPNNGRVIEEDDAPAFLLPGEAVEVDVDDDVPMDDDDEDEVKLDEEEVGKLDTVVDMAKITIESHSGPVYAVAAHRSSDTNALVIVSGGGDDRAFLHAVPLNGPLQTHALEHPHTDTVSNVALNLDCISDDYAKTPPLAAVGSYDGSIVLYNPMTGEKLQVLEGPTDVEWLCFHPKGGTVLLAGSTDGTIWMFHIPMNKCLQVFVGHESAVTAGSFSPDGRWALSTSSDGTLRVWAPRTGASKHIFRWGAGLTCLAVGGGSDGQLAMTGAEDGQAHVCHIGTKKVLASLRHYEVPNNVAVDDEVELPVSVEAVGFASEAYNPNWCATGGVDGVLKVWDLSKDGQCRQTCTPPEGASATKGGITRLQWHPSLPLIFASYTSGLLRLWDARNGALVQSFTGNADVVNDMTVCFSSNSHSAVVVTGSDDEKVRVFEVELPSLS